jgi:predicted nucleic acid-binding protein
MPKPLAYIETTIPNFYYDLRSSEAVTTRRTWTREWWDSARHSFDLVTGQEVLLELSAGTSPLVPLRLGLLNDLPVLPITGAVNETVQTYIKHRLMPGRRSGDAIHVALASHHGCDLILTWNCRHLANPNKFAHLGHLNRLLGLRVPEIVTPLQLLRRADDGSDE